MEEKRPIAQPYDQPDDAELLRRVYGGDQHAFRAIVDRHGRYLTGVALALTGRNLADAEDLVQETFVAALTSRFRGESSARTWLVQILVRRSALLRRKRGRERGTPMPGESERTLPSASSSSDAKLDLAEMLEGLSADQSGIL